ncbi:MULTISPECIES: hypothetical protein [unclassified Streptomyces]|uniref:hypothetical protein n=1 Tax=unclassified Streptomyces TaxID=2593676 RepID=UPI0033B52965
MNAPAVLILSLWAWVSLHYGWIIETERCIEMTEIIDHRDVPGIEATGIITD